MAKKPLPGPLPADLPEDWALNQVVSPNGTEAGLDEKHGFNYQGKQINAAQKGINTLNEGMGTKADVDPVTNKVVADQMPPYQGPLKDCAAKDSVADADGFAVVDSEDSGKSKRVLWSRVKGALNAEYSPKSHTHTVEETGADPAGSAAAALEAAKLDATAKANEAEQNAKDASEKAGATADHNVNATAHMDIRSALSAAQQLAQEAKSLAEGRSRAVSYTGYSTMVAAVNIMSKTAMRIGDNLLLEALGVPDLWVSKVESTAVIYTYTTDAALEDALGLEPVQMGYYKLSMLETPKVDLRGYVPAMRTINGKQLTGNITLTAGDVSARAATWVPSWGEVTGKPTTFPAAPHTHPVSDVTGALKQFGPVNVTIPVGSWSGAGPWTQNVAVSGVLAAWDWRLKLSLQKQTVTDTRKAQEKAMGCVTYCETYNGGIKLTCYEKKPEVGILAVLSGEV